MLLVHEDTNGQGAGIITSKSNDCPLNQDFVPDQCDRQYEDVFCRDATALTWSIQCCFLRNSARSTRNACDVILLLVAYSSSCLAQHQTILTLNSNNTIDTTT